jgi:hypothetical protein
LLVLLFFSFLSARRAFLLILLFSLSFMINIPPLLRRHPLTVIASFPRIILLTTLSILPNSSAYVLLPSSLSFTSSSHTYISAATTPLARRRVHHIHPRYCRAPYPSIIIPP